METVIVWVAFVGAWLLFAGPLQQAMLQLQEERVDRDELARAQAQARTDGPAKASAWWWLVPPVAAALHQIRERRLLSALAQVMDRDQLAQLVHLSDTSTAWLYVAGGALLIAVAETWALRSHYEWPTLVFWLLVLACLFLSAARTVVGVRRRRRLLRTTRVQPETGL